MKFTRLEGLLETLSNRDSMNLRSIEIKHTLATSQLEEIRCEIVSIQAETFSVQSYAALANHTNLNREKAYDLEKDVLRLDKDIEFARSRLRNSFGMLLALQALRRKRGLL